MCRLFKCISVSIVSVITALSVAVTSFAYTDEDYIETEQSSTSETDIAAERSNDLFIPEAIELPEDEFLRIKAIQEADKRRNNSDPDAPEGDGESLLVSSNGFYNTSSNYYYNQFNSEEREFYDNLQTVCENFYNSDASVSTNMLEEVYYSSSITELKAKSVFLAFYWSNPKYFFISGRYYVGSHTIDGKVQGFIAPAVTDMFMDGATKRFYRNTIEQLTREWMAEIEEVDGDLAKERVIYKKIVDTVTYHSDENGNPILSGNNQTIAGALVDKTCVCNGYAFTAVYFCNAAGLDCITVVSETHAWNLIKLYDKWYELDITWADPDGNVSVSGPDSEHIIGKWINKSTKTIRTNDSGRTHIYSIRYFSEHLSLPSCTSDTVTVPSIQTHTVTFYSNGGTNIAEQVVKDGERVIEPDAPIKSGWVFDGWYTDIFFTERYDFSQTVTTKLYLYAKWKEETINRYTVTFNTNGGSYIEAHAVAENCTVTKPDNPTRTGYSFVGWFSDEGLLSEYDFTSIVNSDITIYAKWEIKSYTVTFNTNGGSNVGSQIVRYGEKVTVPDDPIKDNYMFLAWFSDSELTQPYIFDAPVSENITIYAGWIASIKKSYIVIFDTKGGSVVNAQVVEEGNTLKIPDDPIKGYETFCGWYIEPECITAYDFNSELTSSITLYAKWTVETCRVVFHTGSESTIAPKFVYKGESISEPDAPIRDMYYFVGWYSDPGYINKYEFGSSVLSNITLYAKWDNRYCTVVFNTNVSGTDSDLIKTTVKYGGQVQVPSSGKFNKAGYIFDGWYKDKNFKTRFDANSIITTDLTLYAKWNPTTLTITFISNGGSAVASQTVNFGDTVKKPKDPVYTGYEFVGWYKNEGLSEQYNFNAVVYRSFTLYAKWKEIPVVKKGVYMNGVKYYSINSALDAIGKNSAGKYEIELFDDVAEDKLYIPNNTYITINIIGNGHKLTLRKNSAISPKFDFSISSTVIRSETSKYELIINSKKSLTLKDVEFEGNTLSISCPYGNVAIDGLRSKKSSAALVLKGGAANSVSVSNCEIAISSMTSFIKATLNDTVTIGKTMNTGSLELNGALLVQSNAAITIKKSLAGQGNIEFKGLVKPIVINGIINNKASFKLLSNVNLIDKQIFTTGASNLNNVFDISNLINSKTATQGEYRLTSSGKKVYLKLNALTVNGQYVPDWSSVVALINKNGDKYKAYTIELLSDVKITSGLKLPSKSKYSSITINGNGYTLSFSGSSVSLSAPMTLQDITIQSLKNGNANVWTLKGSRYLTEKGNVILLYCNKS